MKIKRKFCTTRMGIIICWALLLVMLMVDSSWANKPPNKPTNPVPSDGATNQPFSLTLSWTGGDPDATDTVTYDVYFGTITPPPLISGNVPGTSCLVISLSPGIWYYWQIVAKDNHGSSTTGSIWRFKTISNQSPGTPTNLTAIATAWNQINLSWKDNADDETEFRIERKTGIAGNYGTIATVGTNMTSYQDKGLNETTTYYYRLRTYNSYNGKVSGYSNEVGATTPLKPFFEVYNNLFDPTKGEEVTIKYTLSWNAFVKIKVCSLYGDLVTTLLSENRLAGHYQLNWSGKDEDGNIVASGIYLVYFDTGDFEEIKKVAVIK